MTREEAIKIINCYDIGFYDLSGEKIPADKLAEAFDMAIEALSKDGRRKERMMFRKLLYKIQKRRFCKLNRWFCPDCIYHDFVFEGVIFRGNKCRYPKYTERSKE